MKKYIPRSNSEEALEAALDITKSIDPEGRKRRFRQKLFWTLLFLALGIAGAWWIPSQPKGAFLSGASYPVGCVVFFLWSQILRVFDEKERAILEADPKIHKLTRRLAKSGDRIAGLFGERPPIQIGMIGYTKYVSHTISFGEISVNATTIALLNDRELDFLVGHELARFHRKDFGIFQFIPILNVLSGLAIMVISFAATLGFASWIHLSLIPLLIGFLFVTYGVDLRQQFACDRLAVEALQNKEVAIAALRKVAVASRSGGILKVDLTTYPRIKKRIEALQNIAL